MAVSAYIFVECEQGQAIPVARALREVEGIMSAHAVTGPVDVVVYVEAEDVNELGVFVISKIQSVESVLHTATNIVAV